MDRGIIPRAISRIYSEIAKKADASYTVHISYVEIYNDQGYDLLDPDHETKVGLNSLHPELKSAWCKPT